MKPKGMCLKQIYNWCNWPPNATIVDLGAWIGITTTWFASRTQGWVFAVEPVEKSIKTAIKNCQFYKCENVVFFHGAISNKIGESEMHIYQNHSEGNSLFLKPRHILERKEKTYTVTWNRFVDNLKIKHVDFCKCNIEGAETLFLKGMTKVFPDKMIIEEHTYQGIADLSELHRLIEEKGYKIVKEEKHDLWCEKKRIHK